MSQFKVRLNTNNRGFLLLEMLVTIVLLTGLMVLLLPAVLRLETQLTVRQNSLQVTSMEGFVQDQFNAQFARLGSTGCLADSANVEIGPSTSKPTRLAHYSLDNRSDWLKAVDHGACGGYGTVSGAFVQTSFSCDGADVGDWVSMSNCSVREQGQILAVTSSGLKIQTLTGALNGHVLVSRNMPFYWFIKPGKSGSNSFWRRSVLSGNALELLPNITHMRIYLVLDQDDDGIADEIKVSYGVVPVRKLAGLLVEYQFALLDCEQGSRASESYQTLRGDEWLYDGVCNQVGKVLVDVKGAR